MTQIILDTQTDDAVVGQELPPAATPAVATSAAAASSPPPLATMATATPTGATEFEKAAVASIVTKVTGSTAVDGGDQVSIDDVIRVVGEFRVTGVSFGVDKDGSLVRTQTVRAVGDLTLVPWNPADPRDNGIVRARP